MAGAPVYSRKLAVNGIAIGPGASTLLFTVPDGVAYIVREISADCHFGSTDDQVVIQAIDFPTGAALSIDDYEETSAPFGQRLWSGRLVMEPGDFMALNCLSESTGGQVQVWVSGYSLTLP